ncbi:MAG: NEW3 domain-containing protein [Sedimentibacter sp.]
MKYLNKAILLFSMLIVMLVSSVSIVSATEVNSTEFLSGCKLSPGEIKTVTFFINNNDTVEHRYKLATDGFTNGYEIYFSSDGNSVENATVPAGSNSQIDLNINLKGSALVNNDKLTVKAVREDGKENIIGISIQINKDYVLSVSSMLNKVEVLNGKTTEFNFSVTNNGSKDLKSVRIEPELPYKWIVSQSSDTLTDLKSGETETFKMTVDIPSSQAAGNFMSKFTAISDETKSELLSIPVTVKTSSNIAYWMIGTVVLIAGVTLIQFKRHGRR